MYAFPLTVLKRCARRAVAKPTGLCYVCVATPALFATHSSILLAPAGRGGARRVLTSAVQEVVLATHQDAFFAETQYANFGEMAEHINAALSEFRVSDSAD